MPRKLTILALTIVALHLCEVLTLGTSSAGSFFANSLKIFASGLAAALCFGARRRGRGMSRPFWLIVGCGMAAWGVANIGWMYYENWLHIEVPRLSVVRFLFDTQGIFFAIALFLDKERDSSHFDAETVLDSLQIAIIFFSVLFGFYYVQLLGGTPAPSSGLFLTWIFATTNLTLTALAAILMASSPTRRLRSLYGGLTLYLVFYTVGSGIADYAQSIRHVPTGTWYDLGWTLPFLAASFWAARWKESAEMPYAAAAHRKKTQGNLAIKKMMLALAPLIVLALVAQLGPERRLLGFSLLSVSILCYAARLGVSEFRQSQSAETLGRHILAMDSAIDGMAILDEKGEHIYVNSAFARMMGYENPQAMLGLPWRKVYDSGDVQHLEDQIRQSLEQDGKWSGQISVCRRNGSMFPLEMAITALAQGGTVCVGRNISERRNAENARAQAEAKYRTLVEQVDAISYIAELGIDGHWHFVSPQIQTILGFSPEEWIAGSRDWLRHVHPEDHPIVEAAEEASKRGERFQAEYRMICKDGRVIWVSDTAVVVPGKDRPPLMEGIIVDITDRKLLENQSQQARRMEAVGRLAGGIAHDFNNLLTIIKGYLEMALNRCQDQPQLRTDIQHIEQASDRAVALIRQLLAFSRKQVLRPKVLDLNSVVLNLDSLLRRLMSENIEMKTFVEKDVGAIKADPSQIEQVIMNLVVNARDAMPHGGRLVIETSNAGLDATYASGHIAVRPGPYVMVAVTDTGVGMTADTVAHIFEPFYTTKDSGRGTGLGLSTVYGIVKQSGGYIWVYSELGKGTTFKVYFPRIEAPADVASTVELVSPTALKGTETILLVEDEVDVRELTRMVLAERGYSVIEAQNPEEAERLAASCGATIHLLLTDVVMPGISGRELAKRVTARHPNVRVLYMSGYPFNVISQDGMSEDGLAFLQKPFTPQVLTQKIRETLDRAVHTK